MSSPKPVNFSIPFWSDFINAQLAAYTQKLLDFQSHFGLILSPHDWRHQRGHGAGEDVFNPILVWFYQRRAATFRVQASCFQSHFGLILSPADPLFVVGEHDIFNPILVWFYLSFFAGLVPPKEVFQSHFGLILSRKQKREVRRNWIFSIPFWSDFICGKNRIQTSMQYLFNPILVWFYHVFSGNVFEKNQLFNPILVWFYPARFVGICS